MVDLENLLVPVRPAMINPVVMKKAPEDSNYNLISAVIATGH